MIPDKNIRRFLKRYAQRQGSVLIYVSLFSVFESLLLLPSVYLIKIIFDREIPNKDTKGLIVTAAIIIVLAVVQAGVSLLHRSFFLRIVKKSVSSLQQDILKSLVHASRSYYDNSSYAEMINRSVADVDKVDKMMDSFLSVLIPQIFLFGIAVGVILLYNPLMGFATLLLGISGTLVHRTLRKKVLEDITAYERARDHLTGYVSFLPQKQILTKMRNAEVIETDTAIGYSDELISKGTAAARRGGRINISNELIINLSAALLISLGAFQIMINQVSYGNIFAIYFLVIFLRRTAGSVQTGWASFQEGSVSLKRIFHLLDTTGPPNAALQRNLNLQGDLEMKNVSFGYGQEKILNNVNFQIGRGEVICITGANGAGKSSLINLLLGFYKPDAGEVTADGINYADLSSGDIRAGIGYVPQNQIVIDGTIESNLTYGLAPENVDLGYFTGTRIFKTLIEGFADGLQTVVRNNGRNLSNGQIQRISILRAIASKPSILILDEPTNHLDHVAISELVNELKSELPMGVIIISHHFLFQAIADRSYLLADGTLTVI